MRMKAVAAVLAGIVAPLTPVTPAAAADPAALCLDLPGRAERGEAILAHDRYQIATYPPVDLQRNLDWRTNPIGNPSWLAKLNTLRWTEDLIAAWQETSDLRYFRRWRAHLVDWLADNPPYDGRTRWGWNSHIAAQRGAVLVCALRYLDAPWLRDALHAHGRWVAELAAYSGVGNHALNKNLDLLLIGCALDHQGWIDLAVARTQTLFADSVDDQGVNDEHAVFYHWYTYWRYGVTLEAFDACGVPPPDLLVERHPLMLDFLTHATTPDSMMLRIGDTPRKPMPTVPGTTLEYASSGGTAGPEPSDTHVTYREGYAFGRSGWGGGERSFADETAYSIRFGPGRVDAVNRQGGHGHADQTALTLHAWGRPLLEDSGWNGYFTGHWRRYLRSPRAHNRLTIEDVRFHPERRTRMIGSTLAPGHAVHTLRTSAWGASTVTRRIFYSRTGDYFLVQDLAVSKRPTVVRQQWNFPADIIPTLDGDRLWSTMDRGNLTMAWVSGSPVLSMVRGQRRPLDGWISQTRTVTRRAATVRATAPRARVNNIITLIVPWAGEQPAIDAHVVQKERHRFAVQVSIGGTTETVTVDGSTASVF